MEHKFERLIRFESIDGATVYGDVTDASALKNLVGATVNVLDGNLQDGFTKTARTATVKKVTLKLNLLTKLLLTAGSGPCPSAFGALLCLHWPELQAARSRSQREFHTYKCLQ